MKAALLLVLALSGCSTHRPVKPVCTCVIGNPDVYERHMADPGFQYDDPADCAVHGGMTE